MKRTILIVAVVMLFAGSAVAISSGPGGRIYMTSLDTVNDLLTIKSVVIGTDGARRRRRSMGTERWRTRIPTRFIQPAAFRPS